MTAALEFRRFGSHAGDLQIDLTAVRPHAMTDALAACALTDVDREALWDLPVGKRIECLLTLTSADEFDVELRCTACGSVFEVSLAAAELLDAAAAAGTGVIQVGDARFRRPAGRDQLAWLKHARTDDVTLIDDIVATLAIDDSDCPLAQLEAAFDAADPLLRAPVTAACPECGHEEEYETDPAGMALNDLIRAQDSLFAAVDALASHYHWTEADILALPEWRRARYVQMIDTGVG